MAKLSKIPSIKEATVFTEILRELFRLNALLLAGEDRLVQPFGLTSARWRVLGAISRERQALTVPQIGRRMGLTRQNVQRLVDAMEDEGLVLYQHNPDHKRAKLVSLTKKGHERYAAIIQVQIPWENHIGKEIKEGDLRRTLKILRNLADKVEQH